eukprot:5548495-Pyramimonas_sp.AAC.1
MFPGVHNSERRAPPPSRSRSNQSRPHGGWRSSVSSSRGGRSTNVVDEPADEGDEEQEENDEDEADAQNLSRQGLEAFSAELESSNVDISE